MYKCNYTLNLIDFKHVDIFNVLSLKRFLFGVTDHREWLGFKIILG